MRLRWSWWLLGYHMLLMLLGLSHIGKGHLTLVLTLQLLKNIRLFRRWRHREGIRSHYEIMENQPTCW